MKRKRVLVTGASGFIGQALLAELRHNHYPDLIPIGTYRTVEQRIQLERLLDYPSTEPSVVALDLQDVSSFQAAVRDVHIVIHLAAVMDFFTSDVNKLMRINVDATRHLLDACKAESERVGSKVRFVYVSSTEAIGSTSEIASENACRNPESPYGKSKMLAEDVVAKYTNNLHTVIARPTGVYGPGERFFFFELMQMVSSGISIIAPSPMSGRMMFTHVEDVVAALILCATKGEGVYNICPDEAVSTMQMIHKMSEVLKVPRPKIVLWTRFGAFLMRIIGPIINFGKRRTFVYHARTVRQSMTNREYSNERLKRLGFVPKYTMLGGIEQTLRYEIGQGAIKRGPIPSAFMRLIDIVGLIICFALRGPRSTKLETAK